jgi:hypothetical protein
MIIIVIIVKIIVPPVTAAALPRKTCTKSQRTERKRFDIRLRPRDLVHGDRSFQTIDPFIKNDEFRWWMSAEDMDDEGQERVRSEQETPVAGASQLCRVGEEEVLGAETIDSAPFLQDMGWKGCAATTDPDTVLHEVESNGSAAGSPKHKVRRFSTLADTLVPQSPRGAVRYRTFYLDHSLLEISTHMIGFSGSSEIYRGALEGKTVAIKQLRKEVLCDREGKELKDLISEICLMCQ